MKTTFESDTQAFVILEANFICWPGGGIEQRNWKRPITEMEQDAIDYLCNEWDWTFEPFE